MLSARTMLEYLDMNEAAERMQKAIEEALKSPENRTKDLGGSAGTKEFAQAVISHL